MRFDVLTLFPELFEPFLRTGVTRRAFGGGGMDVRLWPLRPFGDDTYLRIDDRPYGGGPGMVMMVEPLQRALDAVRRGQSDDAAEVTPVWLLTPTGQRLDQALVRELSGEPGAVLLCGRYEGVDQRFIDRHVTREISLGDFVLSGGELPAMALLDALARLQPGVLGDAQSHVQDSFSSDGLLDCPHYSRPERWCDDLGDDQVVPQVLLSGHHDRIAMWRREQSLRLTHERRPDLIAQARTQGRLSAADERFLATLTL